MSYPTCYKYLAGTKGLVGDSEVVTSVIEDMKSWYITNQAEELLFNTTFDSPSLTGLRMPHDSMVIELEYPFIKPKGVMGHTIYLAMLTKETTSNGLPHLVISPFYRIGKEKWRPMTSMLDISYKSFEVVEEWIDFTATDGTMKLSGKVKEDADGNRIGVNRTIIPNVHSELEHRFGTKMKGVIEHAGMAKAISVILRLLVVLDCANTPVENISGQRMSKSKRNKSVVPDYNMLRVTSSEGDTESRGSSGSKASPRTHWRRGHIKRVNTKNGVEKRWIKPTIVNPGNGEIVKETAVI